MTQRWWVLDDDLDNTVGAESLANQRALLTEFSPIPKPVQVVLAADYDRDTQALTEDVVKATRQLVILTTRLAACREALERIAEPNQDNLRFLKGDELNLLQEVLRLLNAGRDIAKQALAQEERHDDPHERG